MVLEQQPARVRSVDAATRVAGCALAVLASQASQPHELLELGALVRCRREQGYPAVLASIGDLGSDVRVVPLHQVGEAGRGFRSPHSCLLCVLINDVFQILRAAFNPAVDSVDVSQIIPDENADILGTEGGYPSFSFSVSSRVFLQQYVGCVTDSGSAALPNLLPTSLEALRRLGLSLTDTTTQRVLPSLIGGYMDRRNKEVG